MSKFDIYFRAELLDEGWRGIGRRCELCLDSANDLNLQGTRPFPLVPDPDLSCVTV